jgi:hypothetical protein
MRRVVVLFLLVLGWAAAAQALTIRDVIELTRAGLGDEVLLALIEVDRGVYAIDTETLKSLKAAGVSERVIVALVRSGRERPVEPPPPVVDPVVNEDAVGDDRNETPPPQVIVIEHESPEYVREVVVPVPVYLPVVSATRGVRHRNVNIVRPPRFVDTRIIPFETTPAAGPRVRPAKQEYWGFGGKLRPDAWKPAVKPDGHGRRHK